MSDIFISYSRRDSEFAKRLNQELSSKSKDVWIDFEDIPRGIDFLDEIYDGIEKADSLCFLVSRHSLMSEICQLELAHAIKHNKRVLPLILEKMEGDVLKIVKGHWADMAWAELARKNWDVLSHLNWLLFDEPSRFEAEFAALILAAEQDIIHLKTHTRLLVRAIDWQKAEKNPSFLLFGDEIDAAETWLKKWDELLVEKRPNPPPDSLHRDYTEASRQAEKNRQAELANYQNLIQQSQNKLKSEQRAGMITAAFGGLVIGVSIMVAYFLYQFLASARTQAAELQAQSNAVGTEVANANSQLTAIPPTLTQVAADVQAGENRFESLRLAAFAQGILQERNGSREIASLLGIRALNIAYTEQADAVLVQAIDGVFIEKHFIGHSDVVTTVAISPDGRHALSGSDDNTLIYWDIETGEQIRSFTGHNYGVSSVAISPDGNYALSGSWDDTLILWDIETGEQIRSFTEHNYNVSSVVFSPDGRHALSSSRSGLMILWDIETGGQIRTLTGHSDGVTSVAISPDGSYALGGSCGAHNRDDCNQGELFLWDIETGGQIRTLKGHSNVVRSVAISPDGSYALSGSDDNTLIYWDIETGGQIRTLTGHSDGVTSVAISPNGNYAISSSCGARGEYGSCSQGELILWDLESAETIPELSQDVHFMLPSSAISPDGRYAISGSCGVFEQDECSQVELLVYDFATGEQIRTLTGHSDGVTSVAISPDSHHVLSGSCGTRDDYGSCSQGELILWDIERGEQIRSFTGHSSGVTSAAFSPDGRHALSGSGDGTMILWDIETGEQLHSLTGHNAAIWYVDFSPDGRYGLSGSWDNTLVYRDLETGEVMRRFSGHRERIVGMSFSADGRQVTSISFDETRLVWDTNYHDFIAYACSRVSRDFTQEERALYNIPDGPTCPQFSN